MALRQHFQRINKWNLQTVRQAPLAELSGSLGDLGTLLPLMIALAMQGSIDLPATLVFSGLSNILTGLVYGIPLPVQPMKAIAAVAISEKFSKQETAAAGLTMGMAVFALSATGLLRWLNRVVPVPVVKGIQVAAGLSLVISAGKNLVLPLAWESPAHDNRIWAIAAFVFLIISSLYPRVPYALIVLTFGLVLAAVGGGGGSANSGDGQQDLHAGFWRPAPFAPQGSAWRVGAIDAAIPQLPLTTLNSILAVTSLSATLFPDFPPTPSTTSIGFSVALANLIGCWFGAMPVCHGSGGLAGQYRFGARSGASIIILGLVKFLLGVFAGNGVIFLESLPKSLLGIMVIAAGVELAKVGQTVTEQHGVWAQTEIDNDDGQINVRTKDEFERENRDRWMIMLITVAGCLACGNDAVGFLAGLLWHWAQKSPDYLQRLRGAHSSIKLGRDRDGEHGEGLLDTR